MKQTARDLEQLTSLTVGHYDANAEAFWSGTFDHDVSQNIAALLKYLEARHPLEILDFGCGPGRDLKTFSELGHHATGLDGSIRLAQMARAHSGCEVLQQDFLSLDLPVAKFDGVFANATLFHVPSQELPRVLAEIYDTLKPGGVLFSSNPLGGGEEGWSAGRYGTFHDLSGWRRYLSAAQFVELSHFYRPAELPPEQQRWLASVWRKPEARPIAPTVTQIIR
ncbi:MAG: class I SAM-dependent methyltransferase [Burkholderiaceae bacterium]|jgi:SAM-dependent methyltransferase